MLFALSHLHGCYSNLWLDYRFEETFSLLTDSRVPEFIFEPCHLLLEDETRSTRYHRHTAKGSTTSGHRVSSTLITDPLCVAYKDYAQ